jgi:hypothetical protein
VQLQRVAYFWQKSAIALFYEKSATDAYFLGWLRNKNFSGACCLVNPFKVITLYYPYGPPFFEGVFVCCYFGKELRIVIRIFELCCLVMFEIENWNCQLNSVILSYNYKIPSPIHRLTLTNWIEIQTWNWNWLPSLIPTTNNLHKRTYIIFEMRAKVLSQSINYKKIYA